jgi:hypothetical protein
VELPVYCVGIGNNGIKLKSSKRKKTQLFGPTIFTNGGAAYEFIPRNITLLAEVQFPGE